MSTTNISEMPKFIPGLKLCKLFYQKQVRPILNKEFPSLRYSAALIGWGSEVLGFDTAMSRDHHWGPRVLLFLDQHDYPKLQHRIRKSLSNNLPYEFMGYSTNFSQPQPNGVRHPVRIKRGPVNHMVNMFALKSFFEARLGFDPSKKIEVTDWLTVPQQRLLEVVSGEVYHDGLGQLRKRRAKLKFYPTDVWLYLLAAQWTKISDEEAFVGRAGDLGDELGSQVIATRQVREIMKLAFLMEKQYAPYSKWLGTAFGRLKLAKTDARLAGCITGENMESEREEIGPGILNRGQTAQRFEITKPLPTTVSKYFGRPFLVIHGDKFASAIKEAIPSSSPLNPVTNPLNTTSPYTMRLSFAGAATGVAEIGSLIDAQRYS